MAVEGREGTVITVGGKGASLSSHSVFAVANNLAQVRIDSSSLDRLSNQKHNKNQQPPPPAKFTFSLLKNLSPQEARASLLLLLNKLLLSSSASSAGIRPHLPLLISDTLNNSNNNNNPNPSASQTLDFDHAYDVTNEELLVLEKSSLFILDGICAILDHQSSALSSIVDAVAALSCEASGADASAFSSIDSGDGSSANKDEIAVASDLKVFLNGSKLLGKLECEAVSEIPQLHGTFREIARLVHSRTRVELNSPVVFAKVGNKGVSTSGGTAKALATAFLTLSEALRHLGNCSWTRAKLSIDAIINVDLRSSLMEMFNRECPRADSLGNLFLSSSKASFGGQYITFFHELNGLSEMVRKIVCWEAITAFVSLEGSEIIDKVQGNAPSSVEMNVKSDKKSEKRKKVLGKGTAVLMQFIRVKLWSGVGEAVDRSDLLEKWVQDLLSLLDPTHSDFGTLLMKVKEIVESNESRRLPKLPKVMNYPNFLILYFESNPRRLCCILY